MPHTSSQAFLRELDKKLWTAADRLRSNLDAAVYKHAVLGLIFLKYVSDSFAQRQAEIEAMLKDPKNDFFIDPKEYKKPGSYEEVIAAELEERDYYIEKNVFWVPPLARWKTLQDSAKLPAGTEILTERGSSVRSYKITSTGKLIDDALEAVEKENPKLKNVPVASVYDRRTLKYRIARRQTRGLTANHLRTKPRKTSDGRRPTLQLQIDPANLAGLAPAKPLAGDGLIDLIATIPFCSVAVSAPQESATIEDGGPGYLSKKPSITDRRYTAKDILGHRPNSSPSDSSSASLGDLCAFAVKNSSMNIGDIMVFGQDQWAWGAHLRRPQRAHRVRLRRKQPNQSNPTTWRLAVMNMAKSLPRQSETATGGIDFDFDFDFGKEPADTFTRDQHPDLGISKAELRMWN